MPVFTPTPTASSISVDVCIVGAGPAGITIAREFAGEATSVCLIESGGDGISPAAQNLARGRAFGDRIHALEDVCTRAFGGNSNTWWVDLQHDGLGVRYMPLDEMDFEKRDWMPFSGWPFGRSHLIPFYRRAQVTCQSGPFAYDAESWETDDAKRLPVDPAEMQTSMYQFGRGDVFYSKYRRELTWAKNIRVVKNTTAVEVESDAEEKIATRIACVGVDNVRFWVAAKVFVIATGGFENARLLLMSSKHRANGIGNQHDVVGRYFNDHPLVSGGTLRPFDRDTFNRTSLYDLQRVDGYPVMAHLKLSNDASRRNELLNVSAALFPRPSDRGYDAIHAFQQLKFHALAKRTPKHFFTMSKRLVKGADSLLNATLLQLQGHRLLCTFSHGGWSLMPRKAMQFQSFTVLHQIEQSPDPSNRITLGRSRDALGCPTLEVHWRWSLDDADRVARAQALMAAEFRRSGVGEFRIKTSDGLPCINRPSGTHHLMGTTRMHEDPKHGVVDPNCCVHGMSNLFLAGSSVFPTSGYANPTLTIVALALRLADHLKAQLHRLAEPVYTAPPTESLPELKELADEVATPVPA